MIYGFRLDFSLLMRTRESAHPRFEDEVKNLLKNNVISSPNAHFNQKKKRPRKCTVAFDLNRQMSNRP